MYYLYSEFGTLQIMICRQHIIIIGYHMYINYTITYNILYNSIIIYYIY